VKYVSNDRGVLPVLVAILVVVIVAAVGVAVYNVGRSHQRVAQTVSTSPVTAASSAPDPYEGWQVYKSASDGLSFKYPADWKIAISSSAQVDIAPSQGDTSFRVVLRALQNPSTQYDKTACSYTRDIETVTVANLGAKKKMIAYGNDNMVSRLALTDDPHDIIGQEAGCSAVFGSKAGAGRFVDLSAWYGNGAEGTKSFTFGQFTQKPEVQTAEKILRSAAY